MLSSSILENHFKLIHPFIYNHNKTVVVSNKKKFDPEKNEAFYPYVEHYFDFHSTDLSKPPYVINTGKYSKIQIDIAQKTVELQIKSEIYCFKQNIAFLVLYFTVPKKFGSMEMANIIQMLSSIEFEQNRFIKIVKPRVNFKTTIAGYFEPQKHPKSDYNIKQMEGVTRVEGWANQTNGFPDEIVKAFQANLQTYEAQTPKMSSKEWVRYYIKDYEHHEENSFNPLNRTKMYCYAVFKLKSDLSKEFIESLLLQRKSNGQGALYIECSLYSIQQLTSQISVISNEQTTIVKGDQSSDDDHYMNKTFINNYTKNYFFIYLITLFQKTAIEIIITKSSYINFIDPRKNEIQEIKSEILEYFTSIDFTSISNNTTRNIFYKFLRKNLSIHQLGTEADNVVKRLTDTMMIIENKQQEIDRQILEKKESKVNKRFLFIGIFIGAVSIPYKDIFELVKHIIKNF